MRSNVISDFAKAWAEYFKSSVTEELPSRNR